MNYLEEYKKWCESDVFDKETKEELLKIKENKEEIEDRFYKELEFGTAGLRGIIGSGTNRMNKYTVGKATQGLANYIIKMNGQNRGVVIAYDSRHMSKEFSEIAANCLNANGIKTYVFPYLTPTPVLSFAVRELKTIAGIVITASHNPPEYNGYKVYWEDGAQIVFPTDKEIINEVNRIEDYSRIKNMNKEDAINNGLYNIVEEKINDRYIEELKKLVLNSDAIKKESKEIKIVYTPLHGTGRNMVKRILNDLGFEKVFIVKEQEMPDSDFSTVSYPNPEDPKAFELALKLAKEVDADIVLANDPDADRLGVFVKNIETEDYVSFTGNMTGNLIAEYILSQKEKKGLLPENSAIIKTIVSSNLTDEIAEKYNVKLFETLTGFKNIAKIIRGFEEENTYNCQFSYEESYGCIIGTHARDKDGIVAVMTLCEAAAYYKSKGITLYEQMNNIYKKYGYYKEGQIALVLKGIEGAEKIKNIMTKLRNTTIEKIGEYTVLKFKDIEKNIEKDLSTGQVKETGLDKSNVLYYELEDNAWCCVRPSGTEPKIKVYMGIKASNEEEANIKLEKLKEATSKLLEK